MKRNFHSNKNQIKNTLERTDHLDEIQSNNLIPLGELEDLRKENTKLEFVLNKYNFILNEYQLKFGNELFSELDNLLISNTNSDLKKILIENVSLIKEYEKSILERNHLNEFLNSELNRFQIETEKLVEENKTLRDELEITKEEHNRLYKNILNREDTKTGFAFSKSSNLNSDFQSNIELLKSQNDKLLELIESTKYESENYKSLFEEYKIKYDSLYQQNENLEKEYQKIIISNKDLINTKNYAEKKLKENCKILIQNEKKIIETTNTYNKFEIENKYLKEELEHYKLNYDELESRKNSELNQVMKDLEDLRNSHNENNFKISILEDQNSDMKFDLNKKSQELQMIKYDCDHMTKILEESNFAVREASEKEKHIDNIIKTYKKKIDEILLEKEKMIVKQTLLEKKIIKISEDYSKLLQEKQNQFETFIDSSREKFSQIIQNKEEEISNLKNDNLGLKIEKDKFMNEYSTIKKEFDKFSQIFREENDKYIRKYDDTEKSSNRMQNHLQDKINILVKKNEKLEYEKMNIENEFNLLKSTDKNRELMIQKISQNDDNITRDLLRLREKCETLLKEKEMNEKENIRITNLYETKLNQMKEQNELRLTVYGNTMKSQKDDFDAAETKAFDMLKKQENITNKFKDEFRNTVYYYENLVEKIMKDNNTNIERNQFSENYDNYNNQDLEVHEEIN